MNRFLLFFSLSLFLVSCATQKKVVNPHQVIYNQFNSPATETYQTGFILKDLESGQVVFEQNANKNFIAASNIKLLNFYGGLNVLKDSVPSFQYLIKKDSLLIWPMADPTFLHPDYATQKAFDFIKNSNKKIYVIDGRYKGEKFGNGWAWDDYNESYQTEITDFPIYGNVMRCSKDSAGNFSLAPDLFSLYYSEITPNKNSKFIKRSLGNNNMMVPAVLKTGYQQVLPISFNKSIFESLLSDTLLATGLVTNSVRILPWRKVPANAQTIYCAKTDDVYRNMLQESDNFIAEEMLLNYAAASQTELNDGQMIQKITNTYLPEAQNQLRWVDGSGLSRLNLISPSVMVQVLEKIKTKVNNDDRLFALLPEAAKSGTLKNMFTPRPEIKIYAKSGSMTGVYNLSGYLIGKSGKKYAFSYLNNNFLKSVSEVKMEVERFLTYIYDNN